MITLKNIKINDKVKRGARIRGANIDVTGDLIKRNQEKSIKIKSKWTISKKTQNGAVLAQLFTFFFILPAKASYGFTL